MHQGVSFAQWPGPPYRGEVGSQVAGAEALRVGSELALFPLSVCSPPIPASAPSSLRGEVLEQEELVWALGMGLDALDVGCGSPS